MDNNSQNVNSRTKITTNNSNFLNCPSNLVCVQYPGIVKNVEKALETLGGISNIEIASGGPKKNLELQFYPQDLYRKPCVADCENKPSLLVKLRVRRELIGGKAVPKSEEVIDYDVEGMTALTFKFNRLCDFQYLPLMPKTDGNNGNELEYIYNKIIPDDLPNSEWIVSEKNEKMQLYVPPSVFSKFNLTNNQLYFERSKFYEGRFTPEYYKKFKEQEIQQKIIRKDREKNILNLGGHVCSFEDEIPMTPPQHCLDRLKVKYTSPTAMEKIKQERPIWSKQAIIYHSEVTLEQIKLILPMVAYHYVSGPWRIMWVKFGYDPRNDPSSRIYQMFDYRIRTKGGFKLKIKAKRSYMADISYEKSIAGKKSLSDYAKPHIQETRENTFRLKPGIIPAARQTFYQFCDLQLPEIEAMFARLPPVLPGTICDKKNGWLPSGFTEQCREIANKYIGIQIKKEMQQEKEQIDAPTVDNENQDNEETLENCYEISDTSSSSSESEDETSIHKQVGAEFSDNDIDMETVEEINQIVAMSSLNDPEPGPSGLI